MITWDKFFNFNDSQPIDEAIKKLNEFIAVYQKMVTVVEDSNARIAGDITEVQDAAKELLKSIGALNLGMESNEKVLAESSTASENLVKDFMALKSIEEQNTKQISAMTEELNKLNKAKEDASKANESEAGSIDDLRKRLAEAEKAYKAMGDATDQTVKDEQLEKVRGLANEYKSVNGALADAKKGAINAAGSYNELAARVANAKKQLKEMEGGLDGNSKEFKELRKFAKEGTEQLKKWDEAVGDNTRNVGDYKNQIAQLIPGFGGVAGGIEKATMASKAFIATPIGAIIVAIAAAVGALTAYFKSSTEGQDDFNKVMRVGEAILETLLDVVEVFGKVLFEAITKPKETWEKFMKLIKPLGDALKFAFENPMQALKDFGNAILNNIIKRLEGMGKLISAIGKVISSGFTEGWKDLGDAAIQSLTGIEDGIDKLVEAFEPLTNEMIKRIKLGEQIAALENKLRKERIKDIIDDAKTELEVQKLLLEAKDKLRFSDEERFNKLRKANELLEEQLRGDLELIRMEIQLQRLIIQQSGETYESRQKLVELQAQEAQLQTKFFQQRKKRQAEEIALIREIEKEMIESKKRIADADAALNAVRLNDAIKTNQKILADENLMLEERLEALFQMSEAQQELLEQDRDRQLEIAKEAGIQRMELDQETLDGIYSQENLSIQARIELERKAKEELLSSDKAYQTEVLKITEDFNNKTRDLLNDTTEAAKDNVFKVLARDANRLQSQIETDTSNAIVALNEEFLKGNMAVETYTKNREKIIRDAQKRELNAQLEFLEEQLKLFKGNAEKEIALLRQIAAVKAQLSQIETDEAVENEIRRQEALQEIKMQAEALAIELFEAGIQRNIQGLEKQLAAQEDAKNKSLAIAGDDAQARAFIEQEYANRREQTERQIAAQKRKAAIFQKAIDATQTIVSTAKGVAAAVAESPLTFGLPWSAFVALVGGLQLARILSAPIPSFFTGTGFSPEGLIRVADRGREIVVDPSGNPTLYEKESVIDAQRGSKVIPNYKTEEILRLANQKDVSWQDLVLNGYRDATEKLGTPADARLDTDGMKTAIHDMTSAVVTAIKSQPQTIIDEKGWRTHEGGVNARIERLDKRYRLQP